MARLLFKLNVDQFFHFHAWAPQPGQDLTIQHSMLTINASNQDLRRRNALFFFLHIFMTNESIYIYPSTHTKAVQKAVFVVSHMPHIASRMRRTGSSLLVCSRTSLQPGMANGPPMLRVNSPTCRACATGRTLNWPDAGRWKVKPRVWPNFGTQLVDTGIGQALV